MVDIAGALRFTATHATPAGQRLAQFAVGGATREAVVRAFAAYQQADGSWQGLIPAALPIEPTLPDAAWALQCLRWAGAENDPLVARTIAYLATQQQQDGSWGQGTAAEQLLITARICRMVQEAGREPEVYFGPALTYLSQAWETGVVFDPATPITVAAAMLPLFALGGQPADTPLVDTCQDALLSATHNPTTDPAAITMIAHAALNTRYAGSRLYIAARDRMLTHQASDGGWEAATPAARPRATLAALMLLRWGGML